MGIEEHATVLTKFFKERIITNNNYCLNSNFSIRGHWWLPDNPSNKIHGELFFNCQSNIILELTGILCDDFDLNNNKMPEHDIVLGYSEKNEKITLLNNYQFSIELIANRKSKLRSYFIIIGTHIKKKNDVLFSEIKIGYSNLEDWLGHNPFKLKYPENEKNQNFEMSYEMPYEFKTSITKLDFDIESSHQIQTRGNYSKSISFSNKAFLKLSSKTPQNLRWYINKSQKISDFLTLCIGHPILKTKLIGKSKDNEENIQYETIDIFFPQSNSVNEKKLHLTDFIVSFAQISENISDILNKWFSLYNKLESVCNLFFGTFYEPNLYQKFQFLSLIQAIEVFHRIKFGGKYIEDENWNPVTEKLFAIVPSDFENSFKESLKSKFKYGNEFSLRKRLKDIYDQLDRKTKNTIFNPDNSISKIVNTRNYYTHYNQSLKSDSLSPTNLVYSIFRLRALIIILLFKELGLEEEVILKTLRNNPNYNIILNQ